MFKSGKFEIKDETDPCAPSGARTGLFEAGEIVRYFWNAEPVTRRDAAYGLFLEISEGNIDPKDSEAVYNYRKGEA